MPRRVKRTANALTFRERPMLVLFSVALLLRLIHVLAMRASPYFENPIIDAATYDDAARAIAAGHGHPDSIFWQPPGYSYFLSWIYIVLGPGYLGPRVVQALLGAASAVLTAWIGARYFGRRVGLGAGYGVALYGLLIYFDGELLAPSLTIALQLAAIAVAVRARDHPRRALALWGASGLLAGIASVVTAPSLVIGGVLAAAAGRRAWAVVLGVVLAIAPVTLRNLERGGELVPISWNGGINLYIGNNPRYDETVAIRPDLHWKEFVQEPRRAGVQGAGNASRYFAEKVGRWAASDPAAFARLQVKKALLFLQGNEIPRNQEIYPARGWSPVLRALLWKAPGLAFPFGVLMPLGLLGLVTAFRRAPVLGWIVVLGSVSVLAFFITARYRAPLIPLLLIFAAEGVRRLVRDQGPLERSCSVALLLLLFLVGNLGQGPMAKTMNADAEYSLGVRLAMKGRPREAESHLRSALAKNSNYPEAWVNLGVLEAERGRSGEAEAMLRNALAQDPENTLALTNLAVLREKAGRIDEAVELYRRALEIDPTDAFARGKVASLQPAQPPGQKPQ
ncbi:MAG TPA: tetratricopeptide repeat protein [Candidatus Angelobacter sp.]|nr:tetratricopeptide repeat protein [Candidatus Angelobacter sp.]